MLLKNKMRERVGGWIFSILFVIFGFMASGFGFMASGFAHGAQNSDNKDVLQLHYEAAGKYLHDGDQPHAAAEYKAFLAEALHRIANGEAQAGQFSAASLLFNEALNLAPQDENLRLDFASACLDEEKLTQAKGLAEEAVRADPRNARARFLLGRILYHLEDYQAAKVQLEAAVAVNSDFPTGYLLGKAYLLLHDEKDARTLFNEMVTGLGDTALLHIYFGRAYSLMDYPDQAYEEFRKAIERDPQARDAHYYLALAYLRHDETAGFAKAIPQFQAELKIDPNDVRSRYMLGYIALKQRNFAEAESELSKATTLQPNDINTLVSLAEAYTAENHFDKAEATLRNAITISETNSQDAQQAGRAHYLLGRLLMKTGKTEEAKHEMRLSAGQGDAVIASGPAGEARSINSGSLVQQETREHSDAIAAKNASAEDVRRVQEFKQQLTPPIAEAYNNLGAIAAEGKNFRGAVELFEKTAAWDPSFAGVDRNLGMAAFYAQEYEKAAPALQRYLSAHRDDMTARSAYEETLQHLAQPKDATQTN